MKSDRLLLSILKNSLVYCSGVLLCLGVVPVLPVLAEENQSGLNYFYTAQKADSTNLLDSTTKKTFRIGVMAIRGEQAAIDSWTAHGEYLASTMPNLSFELVPLGFEEIESTVENKEVDFVITNPGMYVNLETKYGINRIASLKTSPLGKPSTQFGAVIIASADREDLTELKDFQGKTFAGVQENAFGGWQMAWNVFLDAGIDPYKKFESLVFTGSHDAVVKAVIDGEVDGGTVRTDTLEKMAAAGDINLEEIKVLNPQTDEIFPFLRSTPLYPEWAFSAVEGVPLKLKEELAIALLELSPDSTAATSANIEGWTVPLNYSPVRDLFVKLRIPPYDNLGDFTTAQLLQRLGIVLGAAVLAIAGVAIFFQKYSLAKQKENERILNKVNKSLEQNLEEQKQLQEEQEQAKQELEIAIFALIEEIADAADGDLTVRASLDSVDLSTVADLFNAVIESLQDIAIETKQSSSQVGFALKQNELAIRALAQQALTEAQETRSTLDSVQKMSQSIQTVAHNASQAKQMVGDTYQTVLTSTADMDLTVNSILNLRHTVGETAKKMKRLGESSQKISQAVSFIEEIALKTNILAINATVEAGRAGEYGEGFSIVAEQVATLAQQAATATKDIAEIVLAIQTETAEVNSAMESGTSQVVETTRLVESTKENLGQVLSKSQKVNQLIDLISESTVSQESTSQTVTQLMQKIAQLSETTSQSSEVVAQSILEASQIAEKLETTVAQFKVSS